MDKKQKIREALLLYELRKKERLSPIWIEMGLIAGQPRVLNKLLMKDKVTQKELSDACRIDPATLSRLLDRLEAMGYISRMNSPNCRRSFQIELTDAGREKAVQVRGIFVRFEFDIIKGFSEAEVDTLADMLDRICENIE